MSKSYIVLHKSDWERLHRKTNETNHLSNERDEYFRKLIEKSQSWIKTWPDTVQGRVEKMSKQKEKTHEENIALVKKGLKKMKKENTREAINKARQMIFEDSCYGKQLLSALMESRNLEIRDIQIEFQKGLRAQTQKQENELLAKLDKSTFNLGAKDQENKVKKKAMETELAEINKSIYEMNISKRKKSKEDQKKNERENARLTQEMLEDEARKEKEYQDLIRHDIQVYEKEQMLAKERKAEKLKMEEAAVNAQRALLDKRRCKINKVMKQIFEEKHNTREFKKNYDLIKEIQLQEKLRYETFIQKGVQDFEEKMAQKEKEDKDKQIAKEKSRRILLKNNQLAAEDAIKMHYAEKHSNKCVCVRQSILTKSCGKHKTARPSVEKDERQLSFLVPPNKSRDVTKTVEPSPWNALSASHAHFARCAADTLKDCRHKRFARKVVDEYRKVNCLDAKTLPVPNY